MNTINHTAEQPNITQYQHPAIAQLDRPLSRLELQSGIMQDGYFYVPNFALADDNSKLITSDGIIDSYPYPTACQALERYTATTGKPCHLVPRHFTKTAYRSLDEAMNANITTTAIIQEMAGDDVMTDNTGGQS